jgi:hypothetical protein
MISIKNCMDIMNFRQEGKLFYSIDDVNQKPVTASELRKMTKQFIEEEEASMGDFSDEFEWRV